jgi:hypothetical protein
MTTTGPGSAVTIDTSKPHSARMYDYYLGGKDWYPADQEAAEKVKESFPTIDISAKANRGFMRRATALLASEYGVRQFVDIGTGIPTAPNLHQIAQGEAPECHVVYADFDPLVLEHADALMRSTPEGRTAYIQADVRKDNILDRPELREVIDLGQPVALSLVALMHFVQDEDKPYEIVKNLVDQLCPGSFLVLAHTTYDFDPTAWERVMRVYRDGGSPLVVRTKSDVARFFDGLDMIDPGLAPAPEWRPGQAPEFGNADAAVYAGVAKKS